MSSTVANLVVSVATWLSMRELQDAVTRNVRHVMADFDIDQETIATALGITAGALSNKMSGKRPWKFEDVTKLADYFRLSEMEFVRERRLTVADPFLAATGTDAYGASRSVEVRREFTYSSADTSATVIPFPQVSKPAREMDRLAVIRVLHPRQLNEANSPIDACSNRVKHA